MDRQTDRQTDDMQSQYRALHYRYNSASRGKNMAMKLPKMVNLARGPLSQWLMVLTLTLLQTMERLAYVVATIWLYILGVALAKAGSTRSPSQAHDQAQWIDAGNRALVSAAGSSFEAMMARRNHSVLTTGIGRSSSTSELGVAASPSYKKLLSYQHSAGVTTSGASSQRVSFSLSKLGMAFVNVARPQQHLQLP